MAECCRFRPATLSRATGGGCSRSAVGSAALEPTYVWGVRGTCGLGVFAAFVGRLKRSGADKQLTIPQPVLRLISKEMENGWHPELGKM